MMYHQSPCFATFWTTIIYRPANPAIINSHFYTLIINKLCNICQLNRHIIRILFTFARQKYVAWTLEQPEDSVHRAPREIDNKKRKTQTIDIKAQYGKKRQTLLQIRHHGFGKDSFAADCSLQLRGTTPQLCVHEAGNRHPRQGECDMLPNRHKERMCVDLPRHKHLRAGPGTVQEPGQHNRLDSDRRGAILKRTSNRPIITSGR